MADPEKDLKKAPDTFAAAQAAAPSAGAEVETQQPEATSSEINNTSDITEKKDLDSTPRGSTQPSQEDDDNDDDETNRRPELVLTKTNATDASVNTVLAKKDPRWYKNLNPLRWGPIPPIPDEPSVSRETTAGFFSKLTFSWMTPLMSTGYKRQLHERDIWTVNPDRAVEPLTVKVREAFQRRVKNGGKRPLLSALIETFKFEFWFGGFFALLTSLMQVLTPFTLRYLIQFATNAFVAKLKNEDPPPIKNGIGLAIGITVMQIIQSTSVGHFIYRGMMTGGQSRGVLIGMIYEKAMVISGRAKAGGTQPSSQPADGKEEQSSDAKAKSKKPKKGKKGIPEKDEAGWANGRIVNLMSVDTYRIDQASALFHIAWTSPIACIITLVLLLVNLTYSALAGFALLVIGVPLLTKAIQSLFVRRKAINKITDKRVSLTQEIVQSVRFVKFFGWEMSFLDRLAEIRSNEIHAIQILLAIRNAINAVSMALPIFASMLSFIVFSLTNHGLDPAKVFSSLALFNSLRIPLNMLPLVIGQVTDAWSSLKRIEQFLLEEEQEEQVTLKPDGKNAVEMHQAAFTWEKTPPKEKSEDEKLKDKTGKPVPPIDKPATEGSTSATNSSGDDTESNHSEDSEAFKLQDLNFSIGRDELVAVIGPVGCGKSSLLASLAGDMRKTDGEVVFGASRAFCPQYAWVQNTSLQNNITFGKDMDDAWYNEVIDACALRADLEMLPNGDQTEIGERGITISGGQKQRLNIARAVYFDADIVLMDDPLSAVDAHVGRHIFDNAILGILKKKCRILATHQLWVLSRCDRIIWMDGGKVRAVDTFDKLMADHESFRHLMETTAVEEEEEEEEHDDAEEAADETLDRKDTKAERQRQKKNKKAAALMQKEERAQESVPWSVYISYIRASGSILNAPLVVFLLILSQGSNIVTSLWLSWWTSDKFGYSTGKYIGVYAALGVVQAVMMFAFSVVLSILGTKASKVMLRNAVTRVLRAPMSFFDTTPLGRITNRFSRDVDVMDNNLSDAMRMFFFTIGMVTAVFILVIAYFYYFVIALVPLYILFIGAASYYRSSAREVKRYESVLRSGMFAKFSEGLSGVPSIRAYGLKDRFVNELRESIDNMNAAYYLTFSNQRWVSMRIDMIGNLLVFTVAILVVTSRFNVNPSIGGLVLSYIVSIVQMLQFSIRQLAEVENGMNAVERLQHYGTQLEEEAPLHTVEVRKSWPEKGEIVFDNVEMRYRENLPLVLQGLSIHIKGGERIGVIGRTGAGKSSIMSTLFRLVEISSGSITVDGVNISTIGLADLRSRLAIIPQDPTLFRGTVRSNLDPFNEHTDLALWSALRQADLVSEDKAVEEQKPDGTRITLDSTVDEDGLNFSLGQRQLMALARALVRGSQIIICDEATSSVDMETDDKIQYTMATGFRGKTLLCIAHRLRTIIGYDRICVMDAGQIAELDSPTALWQKEGGIFRSMCDRSGIRLADIETARDSMDAIDDGAEEPRLTSSSSEDKLEK